MMIFKMIMCLFALIILMIIFMSMIERKIKNNQNEKIIWRIEEMDKIKKRDKVVTRTGGLAHDRNRTYSEIQNQNDKKTQ